MRLKPVLLQHLNYRVIIYIFRQPARKFNQLEVGSRGKDQRKQIGITESAGGNNLKGNNFEIIP